MTTTLALLTDRVEEILADTSNAIWSTANIEEAIRQALHDYSHARPQDAEDSIPLTADGREISTSTLTGIINVHEVWCNYDSANPGYPPPIRPFRYWHDIGTIYIVGPYEPQNEDVVRVFYTILQTINGLDNATATTAPDADVSTLAHGAAGYAATTRALDLSEQITVDKDGGAPIHAWGQQKLADFRAQLETIARTRLRQSPESKVPAAHKDRFETNWS